MNRLASIATAVTALTLLAGCGGGRMLLLDQRLSEAPALRAECRAVGLESALLARAANLTKAANTLMKEGKTADALPLLDHAVAIYRLELLKHRHAALLDQKADLRSQISQANGRLETYSSVLNQLKSER
jgi:hypothetical protein